MKKSIVLRALTHIGCEILDSYSRQSIHFAIDVKYKDEELHVSYNRDGWAVSGDYGDGYSKVLDLKYTLAATLREWGSPMKIEYWYH